jgi:hypothetical protein
MYNSEIQNPSSTYTTQLQNQRPVQFGLNPRHRMDLHHSLTIDGGMAGLVIKVSSATTHWQNRKMNKTVLGILKYELWGLVL